MPFEGVSLSNRLYNCSRSTTMSVSRIYMVKGYAKSKRGGRYEFFALRQNFWDTPFANPGGCAI